MYQLTHTTEDESVLDVILSLKDELVPSWRSHLEQIKASGVPFMAGDVDDEENKDDEEEDKSSDDVDDEDGDPKDKKDDDEDDDEESDVVKMPRSEALRLRRQAKEAEEVKRKAAEEKKKAERKKASEEGRFNDLIADVEKERDEAKKETKEWQDKFENLQHEVLITRLATKVGFKDPSDAFRFVNREDIDGDESIAERALRRVLTEKPYLKQDRPATGGPKPGDGNGKGTLTMDDIKGMTEEQINARWEEVQAVLNREREAA